MQRVPFFTGCLLNKHFVSRSELGALIFFLRSSNGVFNERFINNDSQVGTLFLVKFRELYILENRLNYMVHRFISCFVFNSCQKRAKKM